MDVIADRNHVQCLDHLLEFLATWEKRPVCLTPMAYQWCSAISEVVGRLREGRTYTSQRGRRLRLFWNALTQPGCDLIHSDVTSHRACRCQIDLDLDYYMDLLLKALRIGFRLADRDQSVPCLDHTPHCDQMFEIAFSSYDDEVIADAVCAWNAGDHTPAGSCARYFARRVERATPFSPRLRQVAIRAVERIWPSELATSGLEIVRLLHRLDVDVGDVEEKREWTRLLVGVIRSPVGFGSLSPHYWCLLGKLTSTTGHTRSFALRDVEVMRSLEEAEDWEKLEVWMVVVWQMFTFPTSEPMEGIEQVTLKLALRRPSALQRFENLCKRNAIWPQYEFIQGICDRARAEQLPSEALPQP